MSWRLAASLRVLLNEVDTRYPGRSKASDGAIGDEAHQSRCSRHNPNNHDVVCALDITNDPARGCDIHAIAEQLRQLAAGGATNPCFEYVISNGRIASRKSGWRWGTYTGSNLHTRHVHFAVGRGGDCEPTTPYDDTTAWLPTSSTPRPTPTPGGMCTVKLRVLKKGMTGGDVRSLQYLLISKAGQSLVIDGAYGKHTEAAVKRIQRFFGLTADGICGERTWPTLFL